MTWLTEAEYQRVRETVPIVCVDIVPLRVEAGAVKQVGLILRDAPDQGRRWCLVGGRVWRNETLAEAVTRHIQETMGPEIRFHLDPDAQPIYVAQYFPTRRPVGVIDLRQHSVAMNYCVRIGGEVATGGEAHEFRWFDVNRLPSPDEFGFEQDRILDECLRRYLPGAD